MLNIKRIGIKILQFHEIFRKSPLKTDTKVLVQWYTINNWNYMNKIQNMHGRRALGRVSAMESGFPEPDFSYFDGREVQCVDPFDGLQITVRMKNGQEKLINFRQLLAQRRVISLFLEAVEYNTTTDRARIHPPIQSFHPNFNFPTSFWTLAPLHVQVAEGKMRKNMGIDINILYVLLMTYPNIIGEILEIYPNIIGEVLEGQC
ncbi:MAG: hypothetical protein LBQ23_03215 [Puniceicoccales bacterium]|jgi:hypothetical protein|nr:hypothetical protein [Puniceicoccales bacterium]